MNVPRTRLVIAALFAAFGSFSCGSSSHANGNGGGGGGEPDTQPPAISAQPPGGDYPDEIEVTLFADESATVYYTLDGPAPTIGGASTESGEAPVVGIAIEGQDGFETTHLLQYFGVDALGNAGPVLMKQYTIDRLAPEVSQQGDDPAPIGILDGARITWACSDDGSFRVELGGDGSPGSGLLVDSGLYTEPGAPVQSEVPGALLEPRSSGQDVFVIVTDAAGNSGTATLHVMLRGFEDLRVPGDVRELVTAKDPDEPNRGRLYLAHGASQELVVIDTDANEIAGKLSLGCEPTGLALLPDGSRAYVGCASGIFVVDASSLAVVDTISVPNGATPSGLAATPTGQRVYFGSSDGTLLYVDVASGTIQPTNATDYPIERCRIAITPSLATAKGLVAWKGAGLYGAFSFDAGTGLFLGSCIPPTPLDPPGAVAVSPSVLFERGYVGDFSNHLARVSLQPPSLEQFVPDTQLWGVAALPAGGPLLLTHPDSLGLEFRDPQSFESLLTYDLEAFSTPSASAGFALPIAIERVLEGTTIVTRAYVVREMPGEGARLLRVPLSTAPL